MSKLSYLLFILSVMSGLLMVWFAYQANKHPSSINAQAFGACLTVFTASTGALVTLDD
ncbi:hypothetical protein [Microvirga roseola]|uniref:hypothetical protein n=1 Tax=Microvirga roseola TaxID=2883126 RepID=UPI001E308BAE|nr:hypothetical protein [Microvirga roseola]